MDIFGRFGLAAISALRQFRRIWDQPASLALASGQQVRQQYYQLLWSYYTNSTFEDVVAWAGYKRDRRLYRETRSLFNPTSRLVDFYAAQIYPGILTSDGKDLPEGFPSAMPFPADTPPELVAAIAQLWQWTNWQADKAVYVRYGATTGNVLAEVVDDLERAKVLIQVWWPGVVRDLTLDGTGNVKAYSIAYSATEPGTSRQYVYRKDVDAEAFRYYKDDRPYDYDGNGAIQPNPYGFSPAVWVRHLHTGGDWGMPAMARSIGKIDEWNSLASHVSDQIHKVIGSPVVFWTDDRIANLTADAKRQRVIDATSGIDSLPSDVETLLYLKGKAGGRVEPLVGNLPLDQAISYLHELQGEIESDFPELTLWREMRGMSTLTGPAAQRLVGDVVNRMLEPAANYDLQTVKLFQMAVAIAGMRATSGAWALPSQLTRQQRLFTPFGLDSYQRGELDFSIEPRPLVQRTENERWTDLNLMFTAATTAQAIGIPMEEFMRRWAQMDEADVTEMMAARDAMMARMDELATATAGGSEAQ